MRWKTSFLLVTGTLASVCARASADAHAGSAIGPTGFVYHSTVDVEQRRLLEKDLYFLAKADFSTASATALQNQASVMGLPQLTGLWVHNWIVNRARLIVGEKFRADAGSLIDAGPYVYDEPSAFPVALGKQSQNGAEQASAGRRAVTVMSNIGGAIYLTGKKIAHLAAIDFDGKAIAMTSPRMGVLRVGPGLFDKTLNKDFGGSSTATARLFRLATLVHESRHSDGHGESAVFLHQKCPAGHAYENLAACDIAANGPYNVQAGFLRLSMKACKNCSLQATETLHVFAIDNTSRVIGTGRDAMKASTLRERLETNQALITLAKALGKSATSAQQSARYDGEIAKLQNQNSALSKELGLLLKIKGASAPNWDAKPEGRFTSIPFEKTRGILK